MRTRISQLASLLALILFAFGCGQGGNAPVAGGSAAEQQVAATPVAMQDVAKEDAAIDDDWDPPVDQTKPLVRIDQTYEIDEVGNAATAATIKFPPVMYASFKRMMSPFVPDGGQLKWGEPRIKNALRFLDFEEADVLLDGLQGKFIDDGLQVDGREIGRAKQRNGRWTCAISQNAQTEYRLVRKGYRNGVPTVTIVGATGKDTGLPGISQLQFKLPRGAHDILLTGNPARLVYQAPTPKMTPGKGRVTLDLQTKPHIMSALAKLYGDRKFHKLWVARAVFRNNSAETLTDYRVRFRLSGYSDWSRWETSDMVLPGQTVVDPYYPAIDPEKVGNLRGQTPADVQVEYSYVKADGKTVTDSTGERTRILGINEGVFSDLEVDKDSTWFEMFKDVPYVLGSFTSANDPVIQDVVGMLSKATKGAPTSSDDGAAMAFLQALYNLMRVNISYETTPGDKIDGLLHQHLKYGRDVLRTKSGTCVNTSIFFASVVEAAGLDAFIWVVPGHAFAGTRLPKSGKVVAVETTCCGGGTIESSAPFETALHATEKTIGKYAPLGLMIEVNIRQLRRMGVQPPELANAGKNPLAEWNIVPPPEGQLAVAPPGQQPDDALQPDSVWISESPKRTLTIYDRQGAAFLGRFETQTVDRVVSGTIKNGEIVWLAKNVRADKGGPGGDNVGNIHGDTIDFTWRDANGNTGKFSLRRLTGSAAAPSAKAGDSFFAEGKEHQKAQRWADAEEAFNKAIKQDAKNASYYNGRALLYMDVGDASRKAGKQDDALAYYEKALGDLVKATEIDPMFARAYNNGGVICNRTGDMFQRREDHRQAIDFYTHAIECDPKFANAYRNRGITYNKLGEKAKGAADLRKAEALEGEPAAPTPPPAPAPAGGKTADDYFEDGKRFQKAKDWEKACEAFDKAVDLDGSAKNYNGRALMYMDLADEATTERDRDSATRYWGQALDDLLKAVKIDPKFTSAWNNAGVICNRTGDNKKAIEFYDHAIACDPNNARAYRNRGLTYRKLGNKTRGDADIKKAEELDGK